jgi:hypothetical protein
MAGYAATGRIARAHPRFAGAGAGWTSLDMTVGVPDDAVDGHPSDTAPLDKRIVEWWSEAREEWAQATFFLFDPNSWR